MSTIMDPIARLECFELLFIYLLKFLMYSHPCGYIFFFSFSSNVGQTFLKKNAWTECSKGIQNLKREFA